MVELVRRLGWSYVSTVAAEVNNPESLVHYQQHYNIIVFIMVIMCKGLSIYYVIRNGGGLPDLLEYYIGGGVPNFLQYYIGGVLKVYYNITVLKGKWKVIFLFQL